MADVVIPNPDDPKLDCVRYSPMGFVTDGVLVMEARFGRTLHLCMQAVLLAKHQAGQAVSKEAEEFIGLLHSLVSDAETKGCWLELRTKHGGGREGND